MSGSRRKKKAGKKKAGNVTSKKPVTNPRNTVLFDSRIIDIRSSLGMLAISIYLYVHHADYPVERPGSSFEEFLKLSLFDDKTPRDPEAVRKALDLLVTRKFITPEQRERHIPPAYRNPEMSP